MCITQVNVLRTTSFKYSNMNLLTGNSAPMLNPIQLSPAQTKVYEYMSIQTE